MPIKYLKVTHIGPFKEAEFVFDGNVNCFVGPNNCGKSTILFALADILVFPFSIPRKIFSEIPPRWKAVFEFNGQVVKSSGSFPISLEIKKNEQIVGALLRKAGFTAFIPAIRRSTDFRSSGPSVTPRGQRPPLDEMSSQRQLRRISEAQRDLIAPEDLEYIEWHREVQLRLPKEKSQLRISPKLSTKGFEKEFRRRKTLIRTGPFLMSDNEILLRPLTGCGKIHFLLGRS